MEKLEVGQLAPDFRLKNSDGVEISLKDLLHKKVVLYFYPKDNTPGCTLEAKDFSDLFSEFEKKNAVVVGVSPDNAQSHQKFISQCSLNVILLCDEDKKNRQSLQSLWQTHALWEGALGDYTLHFHYQHARRFRKMLLQCQSERPCSKGFREFVV